MGLAFLCSRGVGSLMPLTSSDCRAHVVARTLADLELWSKDGRYNRTTCSSFMIILKRRRDGEMIGGGGGGGGAPFLDLRRRRRDDFYGGAARRDRRGALPRTTKFGQGRVSRGQPHHCTLHKCVARFVSDSRVSCNLYTTYLLYNCRICNREVADSNFGRGYFAPKSTQPSIPPGSVNEYQL